MNAAASFDDLIAEGSAVPTAGWDFSWFEGRATEERPSWGYLRTMSEKMAEAHAALDIETGGGEVLAKIPRPPARLIATESWPPNLAIAERNLRPLGGGVVQVADDAPLPFEGASFDLVVSRHPNLVLWDEVARVLRPGGTYFAQLIGEGTNRELYEFLMGPQPRGDARSSGRAVAMAEAAGLVVTELREESLRVEFFDVAAVVYFLRKVIWTVPDFTVERYLPRLLAMHEQILANGSFVSYSRRILFEARKPLAE